MNQINFPDIYVINLEKRTDRWNDFLKNNAHLTQYIKRFNAINGSTLNKDELIKNDLVDNINTFNTFSNGTIGCALSHKALWEMCININKPIIVCEDDAILRNDLIEKLNQDLFNEIDFILLGYNFDSFIIYELIKGMVTSYTSFIENSKINYLDFLKSQDSLKINSSVSFYKLYNGYGVPGYLITPSGAKKLLEMCFPLRVISHFNPIIKRTINTYTLDCIQNVFYSSIDALICVPPLCVTPNDKSTSDCTTC